MRIVICGISGFVGSALKDYFEQHNYEVIPLSIRPATSMDTIISTIDNCDVIINLSGANILGRWSREYKNVLRQSRLETTDRLVEALKKSTNPPHTFLNASAIGVYDNEHQHDDYSRNQGDDFLATLVRDWEYAALRAVKHTRVCLMRFGVVYGKGGGAMDKMIPPFKMGLGGKMGDGFQMISWIHVNDLVRACEFVIEHPEIKGVVNCTAPEPISNIEQTKIMGFLLHRPTFFDLPAWIVKLAFGEGSSVMLDSKEVYPRVLQEAGFTFNFPTFESAMIQIITE